MNAIVLAPHTDDEVLGCGGTIVKLIDHGYNVRVYAFSQGTAESKEFHSCVQALGGASFLFDGISTRYFTEQRQEILDAMIVIREEWQPKIVFIPASDDIHQDHQVINQEAIRAFKHSTIYGCEYPWNSTWFKNSCYSVLTPEHVNKKIKALTKYGSQQKRIYFKEENVISLARVRGMQANSEYAECFEVVRQFL